MRSAAPDRDGGREKSPAGIERIATGIEGFDDITLGGLPANRVTLVTGSAGAGKTVFAAQFLAAGIEQFGESGVFVTFEEPPAEIVRNVAGLGWDVDAWVDAQDWAFVDASPEPEARDTFAGPFDLDGLLVRVEHAIRKTGARRVAIDSTSAVFASYPQPATVRRDLFRLSRRLMEMGVTGIVTAERPGTSESLSRHGVEEFLADNVVVLRNRHDGVLRQRTVEVVKLRGVAHQHGEFAFTIRPGQGIVGVPLSGITLDQESSHRRICSGVAGLDDICGGGLMQNSTVLVAGSTGTGKSVLSAHFIAAAANEGPALLIATEESRQQIFRNASGWNIDLETMEKSGALRIVCRYPESCTLEDHLIEIKEQIEQLSPRRVAVDSLTALERISSEASFKEFVISLSAFLKKHQVATLFTSTTAIRLGASLAENAAVSTTMDSIVMLRYVEEGGALARGLLLLKMRGSQHSKRLHRFEITDRGMVVGGPFANAVGILRENPHATGD